MIAMPQLKDPRSAEPKRDLSPELTRRVSADFAADGSKAERKIRAKVSDDVFAVIALGCLVIGGAFVFYVLFGMQ